MNLRNAVPVALLLLMPHAHAAAQSPEDRAWSQVIQKQRDAIRLLDQERMATGAARQQLYKQRVGAFRLTAAQFLEYVSVYIPDPSSVSALNAQFRMGYYREYSAWDQEALLYYEGCRSHPRLMDPAAVFGDPARPLAPQVDDRIREVRARLKQDHADGTSVHNEYAFARYSGKGGIDLQGVTPPAPLRAADSLRIAARLSFPSNVDMAGAQWRQLLGARSELSPINEDRSVPGLLVFGAGGDAATARLVATTLETYRRQLTTRYFDLGLPAPTLVVLANLARPGATLTAGSSAFREPGEVANAAAIPRPAEPRSGEQRSFEQRALEPERPRGLDGEAFGRLLSTTVHFRDMRDMEGYYESLDHTLVLRKNLVESTGKLFLGTALHELVHSMIHVDYPQAPLWLDEGMAALHEEYGPDEPRDNYRLYFARAAMDAGRWPTLKQLFDPDTQEWNSKARPVMVAAARYFCMFLWKEGRLAVVYRAMRDAEASGGAPRDDVIARATGQDLGRLEARWQAYIKGRNLDGLDRWESLREPIRRYVQQLRP